MTGLRLWQPHDWAVCPSMDYRGPAEPGDDWVDVLASHCYGCKGRLRARGLAFVGIVPRGDEERSHTWTVSLN